MYLQDVDFGFVYPEDFQQDLGNLRNFLQSDYYKQNGFGIRVYRRGNIGDFRDFEGEVKTFEEMETFIFKSTFVGQGADFIRNLDPENTMKFFGQSEPGLVMFYDPAVHDRALKELEMAFPDISNQFFVLKANIHDHMTKYLAQFVELDLKKFDNSVLSIIVPGNHHSVVKKYKMPEEM